jgi:hypothetical protein
MIRSLITPQTTELHIAIPDDYIGKKVEVLVFTYDEPTEIPQPNATVMGQFWGVISENTTKEMHKHVTESRQEW